MPPLHWYRGDINRLDVSGLVLLIRAFYMSAIILIASSACLVGPELINVQDKQISNCKRRIRHARFIPAMRGISKLSVQYFMSLNIHSKHFTLCSLLELNSSPWLSVYSPQSSVLMHLCNITTLSVHPKHHKCIIHQNNNKFFRNYHYKLCNQPYKEQNY